MHLKYYASDDTRNSAARVLLRDESPSRTELHIKCRDDSTFMLVCLAGIDNKPPTRIKAQGPFHSLRQVQGARNAIMSALKKEGFLPVSSVPYWEINAQLIANTCRQTLNQNIGDFEFYPKDVL